MLTKCVIKIQRVVIGITYYTNIAASTPTVNKINTYFFRQGIRNQHIKYSDAFFFAYLIQGS